MTRNYDENYLDGLIAKAKKSWEGVDVESYMSDLRDNSFDKEFAENLSKEVASYITEQMKSNMKTIEERARLAAWQIYEEIGLSQHSVDRVSEIITEKMLEQKAIDEAKLLKLKSAWEKEAQINHDDEANRKQGYHDAIEKACEWLKEQVYQEYGGGPRERLIPDTMIEEFRKSMGK